jgi:hypothetical protein
LSVISFPATFLGHQVIVPGEEFCHWWLPSSCFFGCSFLACFD